MHRLLPSLAAISLILASSNAWPDSDGYYCIGTGFIAWQLNQPGIPDAHKLFVIRFEGGTGPIVRTEVTLPDFQLHDMVCDDNHARLTGWDIIVDAHWSAVGASPIRISRTDKTPGPTDYGNRDAPESMTYGPGLNIKMADMDSPTGFLIQTTRRDVPQAECSEIVTVMLYKYRQGEAIDSMVLASTDVPKECG